MTWSPAQCRLFVATAAKAGLNDAQRYNIMRYVGCPNDLGKKRPTVSASGNTNRHFRECMAVVEAECKAQGLAVRPPRDSRSWDAACNDTRAAEAALARAIAREAQQRLSGVFDAGLLDQAVRHVADHTSNPLLPGVKPDRLEQCDGPTTHRVTECLRAWVGRKFLEGGLTPRCFHIPPEARRRVARLAEPVPDASPGLPGEVPERSAGGGGPSRDTARRSA